MSDEMTSRYDPKETEEKIYKLWEKSGFFNPDKLPDAPQREPFTIIMPPTNANGSLHAGHALVLTIEDIMTRYKRMRGFKALWLPGLDHAGFETQVVYEKELEKEGRSRFGMERQKLYEEIMEFTLANKKNIEEQTKKMGASCDWSREKFTLDADIVTTVYQTFKKLYDDGLVYRGRKIVNWCSKHQTSLSDLETADVEQTDQLYYLKYGPFTIATARPETKFGDKYVVMHPDDKRYAAYKDGQKIELEWINGPVTATVVKDAVIDMGFGTGVMTITPWHDAADFDIAERHGLDREQIIDFQGRLLPIAGEFAGIKISEARPKIVEKLRAKGLLEKVEKNYAHVVKACHKCGMPIEPQVKDQWFVKMKPLAEPAIRAIEKGDIVYIPEHYKKISLHWLNNILDWNISRQIAWGIPIPAWCRFKGRMQRFNKDSISERDIKIDEEGGELGGPSPWAFSGDKEVSEMRISAEKPEGEGWQRDPDTFDTWFSSGQWPFAVLLAQNSSKSKIKNQNEKIGFEIEDYKTFYPTDVMETGGDIIFFWVARMIMFALYITGKVPFKTVYLHGLVLDAKGKKMSKSRGNVINPVALTEKYGTDALRIGLVVGNTPGTSLALSEDRIHGYKYFANKVWNIARFVLANVERPDVVESAPLTEPDQKELDELEALRHTITADMDDFRFYLAAEKIYHYVWHTFADKIVEESKKKLKDPDPKIQNSAKRKLLEILTACLKMLHPFMPFITEEVYQKIRPGKLLMVENW